MRSFFYGNQTSKIAFTMKSLCLDISTKTGWAFFENDRLVSYGLLKLQKTIDSYGKYPLSYESASEEMGQKIAGLVQKYAPDVVVIEETNKGRARFTQKILEFIHKAFLHWAFSNFNKEIKYLDTSYWRKKIELKLTEEDKEHNKSVKKKKAKGKVTLKHLSVRKVNEKFKLDFLQKDNDIADAICIGMAYLGIK